MSRLQGEIVDRERAIELLPGNRVTLLQNGEAYFTALEAAIDRAVHEIYLETYIYKNDSTGLRIGAALQRAARRGVKAHLLLDGFGSQDLPRSVTDELLAAGVAVAWFRKKISPWTFKRKRLRRLHRKIAVVDRDIAFVGGINIADDMNTADPAPFRYDYTVAVAGPLVQVICLSARRLWSLVAWTTFRTGTVREGGLAAAPSAVGTMQAGFLVRDNFRHRRDIEDAYLRAIEQAKFEVIIANAYFLPGIQFRHALIDAVGRGVRVTLLVQGRVEYLLQHYATRALYGNLLDAGVEIQEYHESFMHAKVAVIDERWATVGSSNLDPFSLLLSREANVVVDNEEFAGTLKQSLQEEIEKGAQQISKENWHHQPAPLRLLNWLSYGFMRLLMGISGYADGYGPAGLRGRHRDRPDI
ncbi:MAG: cardiolipin synthase [Deltaproteobacteria bacterium]|nr:cardiolipin synthase [Deltaproteobacteria bacterium]